jgi:hypothetical protein
VPNGHNAPINNTDYAILASSKDTYFYLLPSRPGDWDHAISHEVPRTTWAQRLIDRQFIHFYFLIKAGKTAMKAGLMLDIVGVRRVSIFGTALCLAISCFSQLAAADDKHRPKTMIPAPSPARTGCRLSGEVYDTQKNQTTFSYDCDSRQPDGTFGYREHKPGNYFKNRE